MLKIFDETNIQTIKIVNQGTAPGVVVVLPMTRVKENSLRNWERIFQIAESSNLLALVLIDKTPFKQATTHFLNARLPSTTQVYILQREITEDLYDSLLSISIEGNTWIMQLHDDDFWSGTIELPSDAKQNEIFPVNFSIREKSTLNYLDWENSPPARINFTLVPRKFWTRFTEFASAQGGHLAASTDYTLNLIARLTCDKRNNLDFDYIYDASNWKKRTLQRSQLNRLSRIDGWSNLSGTDIQLLNRTLDALSCLYFFKSSMSHESFQIEVKKLQTSLKLSLRRKTFIQVWISILVLLVPICAFVRNFFPLGNLHGHLQGQLIAARLVTRVSNAKSFSEIKSEILKVKDLVFLPRLEKRFEFWIKNIGVSS